MCHGHLHAISQLNLINCLFLNIYLLKIFANMGFLRETLETYKNSIHIGAYIHIDIRHFY